MQKVEGRRGRRGEKHEAPPAGVEGQEEDLGALEGLGAGHHEAGWICLKKRVQFLELV